MGQEIVYCFKCQIRLSGSDFERGKAFRVQAQVACADCVRSLLAELPDPDAELERLKKAQIPKAPSASSSSAKLRAVRPGVPDSTSRISLARTEGSSPPKAKSQRGLLWAIGGGVALLLILLVLYSGKTKEPQPEADFREQSPPKQEKTREAPREVHPPYPGPTSVSLELQELDARIQALLREKRLKDAAKLLMEARSRHATLEWKEALETRDQKLAAHLGELLSPILDRVRLAVRKGDEAALRDLERELGTSGIPGAAQEFEKAISSAKADPWMMLELSGLVSESGTTLALRSDRSVLASGETPIRDTFRAAATVGMHHVRAFRLEALSDPSLPAGGPGRAEHGNFVLSEFKVLSEGRSLAFSGASSDYEQNQYPSSAAIDGNPLTGWAVAPRFGQSSTAIFHLQSPIDLGEVAFVLEFQSAYACHILGSFRISATSLEQPAPPGPRPVEATPLTTPKPEDLKLPPEALRSREIWGKAVRLASGRDFVQASKLLEEAAAGMHDAALRKEAEEDRGNFLAAAELLREVPRLLPRWTKGTKLKLDCIAPDGQADPIEGIVVESSARAVTLQGEGGAVDIPAGELGWGALSLLVALRGEKKAQDARALAVLSACEGRLSAELPAKYSALKDTLDPREKEARSLFWRAEGDFVQTKSRAQSEIAFGTLLETYGQTAFVQRNRAFVEDRIQGARDLFFFADDLSGAGTFAPVLPAKMDPHWTSSADSPAAKASENYLEADLQIQAGATYRAWIYAGGCCQEVFTFFLQGTGLSGPSAKNPRETVTTQPGGEEWIATRPNLSSLKKKHSEHLGPKHPERWVWIDLGVLKFGEPGAKKLRILTEEKGFSVAYLVVSAQRQAAPRLEEVKELSRSRPPLEWRATGAITRELWRGVPGYQVADLLSHPKFASDRPDESELLTSIEFANLGTDYGSRIRGYLYPPLSGEYTFWIAADDVGELWLSLDETPAKKQKLCSLTHYVNPRDWDADPSQRSAPVRLVEGLRYYIEVLQKQGAGGDHLAVGWQLPSGVQERPIPGTRLSPVGAFPPRKPLRGPISSPSLDGLVTRSPYVGGQGGAEFEDAPNPRQLLRGFSYSVAASGALASLKPLYTGPGGETEGGVFGKGEPKSQVIARPGYAVGGIVARGTDRLNSFKILFVRVSRWRFDLSDRYESDWIGSRAGGPEVPLGGPATPIVGIFGRAGEEIDGAGVLLVGK